MTIVNGDFSSDVNNIAGSFNAELRNVSGNFSALSGGDMAKSVYDLNNNGIVDDSEKLSGYNLTALPLNGGYF